MKYVIYPIVICLLTLCHISMSIADNATNDLQHYQKINLPYSSKEITKYYYEDKMGEIHISPTDKMPFRFSAKEYSYTPKLARFPYKSASYFPAIYFNYKNILYKGIIYITYGDNDNPSFYFQLNSYDTKGKFIDAILLDERLSAEGEALWWRDFKIQSNGRILVNQMEKTLIEDEEFEVGDIHALKKSIYQMSTSGVFKKIKETVIHNTYDY